MKQRRGFVSNSSSSSFMISLDDISMNQHKKIENYIEICKEKGIEAYEETSWEITINTEDNVLEFWTQMDNFDMIEYLNDIGIDSTKIMDSRRQ